MSEETTCFEAELFDGDTRLCVVQNDGKGGAHRWSDYSVEDKLDDYAMTLRKPNKLGAHATGLCAEHLVSDLVYREISRKHLVRLLKHHMWWVDKGTGEIVRKGTPTKYTPFEASELRASNKHVECVLNELPLDQALDVYIKFSEI